MLSTTVVGSYPQPGWLVDQENLRSRLPPRVRLRRALDVPPPDRLIVSPDWGMKCLPRSVVFGKLSAMVKARRSFGAS